MKKYTAIITALLIFCMSFAFTACGGGNSSDTENTADAESTAAADTTADEAQTGEGSDCDMYFPCTGFAFDLPEGMEFDKGFLYEYDMGELGYGSGVMLGWPVYADISVDEYNALTEETVGNLHTGYSFRVVCVENASTPEEAKERLVKAMEDIAGGAISEDEKNMYLSMEMVNQQDGYIWLVHKEEAKTEGIREECQEEYGTFFDATDEIVASMKFFTPQKWEGGQEGADVTFETTDLDGNPVDSASLFAKNKVTMINIWATTCGPCIQEMPELEAMNEEFREKGGAVVGLVENVPLDNNKYLSDAQTIIKETGVTFTNLRPWEGYDEVLSSVGTPTTYFVDSQGKLIGEPILGASVSAYREAMEEYLAE